MKTHHVWINNHKVVVPEGSTILCAAKEAGIRIPTLCYVEGLHPIGACRVCVVEVEGSRNLVTACSTQVAEGMRIHTNSGRVRRARAAVVELLLSEHNGECQTCERNGQCELQSLAAELGIRQIRFPGQQAKRRLDFSTAAIVRDSGKCIKCRRCVSVCQEMQHVGALSPQFRGFDTVIGPAFGKELASVSCVQCGQCTAICPVGAITERDHVEQVWAALDTPENTVVVQTAPAIRAALGECFGYPPGTLVTGKMVAALRRLGFDAVFDTTFGADLTIIEEAHELLSRLRGAFFDNLSDQLPMFTSCSPAWVNFVEYFHPELLPRLSTCKSPQQMMGAVIKTYYARKLGKRPEDVFVVSVMPCTAKKFEATRPEMNASGVRDVDAVLTTRELARMIRAAGIDFTALPEEQMDPPLGLSTGAGVIFGHTGGVMEAALRTAYELLTGRELPMPEQHLPQLAHLHGIKEAEILLTDLRPEWRFLEGMTLRVAVAHSLGNAESLIRSILSGERKYHFVEVMACPGGCIGGGGQPRFTDNRIRAARIAALQAEDKSKPLRKSHLNPQVQQLYAEFLGEPLGVLSHRLLHTHYFQRERV